MVVQDSHIQAKSYRTTLARSVTVTNGTFSQFFPEISYLDPTTNERRREMSLVKSVDIWHGCNCVELKKTKYSIIRSNIQHKSWVTEYAISMYQPAMKKKFNR